MGSVRKRIMPDEEKRMWLWIYNNLKTENKDAYLSCGLQIWNQYIEFYGIKDRTAHCYATRFRKIMKPSIITCQLKPSQIEFIIKKSEWNITPSQQLLLQKMLADEKALEDGNISGYISEESSNDRTMMKEERSVADPSASNNDAPSTSKMVEKSDVEIKKEPVIVQSSRRSKRCSNKVLNYNEKFLSRRSYDSANSSTSFNSSLSETPCTSINIEQKTEEPLKVFKKRRACSSEVLVPVKKRIVSDSNSASTSISVYVKEENREDVIPMDTVVEEKIVATAEKENIPLTENIIPNAVESNEGGWDPMDDEHIKSKSASEIFIDDESMFDKENVPYSETPKNVFISFSETSKESNDSSTVIKADESDIDVSGDLSKPTPSATSIVTEADASKPGPSTNLLSKESDIEDQDQNLDITVDTPGPSTDLSLDVSSSDNAKTTPIKIAVPLSPDKNIALLTPKSILSSGQRKQKDDGSAVRVRFQSPEKSAETNITPKRTNISLHSTPSTPEFSVIDTEILQLLWHKVHGPNVNDLSVDELVAFKKISLFKDLHVRIKNVQTFFRGRKATLKIDESNNDSS
uniref:Uncharacterized protein n=1 Tax=Panagrolaimus davidi TaxID=227884 RepID=A0A914QSA2_9BILA